MVVEPGNALVIQQAEALLDRAAHLLGLWVGLPCDEANATNTNEKKAGIRSMRSAVK